MAQWLLLLAIVASAAICLVSATTYKSTSAGLTVLPTNIPNNTLLLDLSSNNLAGANFTGLTGLELTNITLQINGFTELPNVESVGATLLKLDLRSNNIASIDPMDIDALVVLEILDLGLNNIGTFPDLTHIGATLLELYLDTNGITDIQGFEVEPLDVLTVLNIDMNNLATFPNISALGDTLVDLEMRECKCYPHTLIDLDILHQFTALKRVDIYVNNLEEFPDLRSSGRTLKYLDAAGNTFTVIDPELTRPLTALEDINLLNVQLTVFPDFTMSNASLTRLKIHYNPLLSIPAELLSPLTQLRLLVLTGCSLVSFPSVHLPFLYSLRLDRNKLQTVPDWAAMGSPLIELQLGLNMSMVHAWQFKGLDQLKTLNFDGSTLQVLPDVSHIPSLQELHLIAIPITTASPRAMYHLGKLTKVVLKGVELKTFPSMCPQSSFLELQLENIAPLDLCNKKMAWLKQSFFTVTVVTDVMCSDLGKMWSAASFQELLRSNSTAKPGDVRELLVGKPLPGSFCGWPSSGILTSTSLSTCIQTCMEEDSCFSFNYNPVEEACAIVAPTAGQSSPVTVADSAHWEYYAP